jgi:hypothetical protein
MLFPLVNETLVVSAKTGKRNPELIGGQFVEVYYNSNKPAPMIYPPTITPDMIFVGDESDLQQVKLDTFDQNLVSEDNELKLHISSDTVIINSRGETLEEADISGNTLFVFYTITSRSIPAQTTPHMIIVIDK